MQITNFNFFKYKSLILTLKKWNKFKVEGPM